MSARSPMSMPSSSAGSSPRSPYKKSPFMSFKRDMGSRSSPASDTYYGSPPSPPPIKRSPQTYFDRYPRPSTSPRSSGTSPRPSTSPSNASGRVSPTYRPIPSFDELLFPQSKSKRSEERLRGDSTPAESSYAFPSRESTEDLSRTVRGATSNSRARCHTGPASDKSSWIDSTSPIPPLRFSGSSTQTQSETPPQTPVEMDFYSYRSSRDRFPVVVAAPIPGVEAMDALIDGMNGGDDYFVGSASSRLRHGIPGHHPLYQPPLPTPPPGVVLGGPKSRRREKSHRSNNSGDDDDDDDGEDEAKYVPSSKSSRRRVQRPDSSRKNSNHVVVPSSRPGSSASANKSPSTSALFRPSSSNGFGDSVSTLSKSPSSPKISSGPTTPAKLYRDEIQTSPPSKYNARPVAPSISEIIRNHAPSSVQTRSRPSTGRASSYAQSNGGHATVLEEPESEPEPLTAHEEAELISRSSSVDSIADEVRRSLKAHKTSQPPSHSLQHAHSFPTGPPSAFSDNASVRSPRSDDRAPSIYSSAASSHHHHPLPSHYETLNIPQLTHTTPNQVIAQYLRSKRLTTLIRCTRSPHASQSKPLTVSLSDLGDPDGFPLVVFLGLGCVRHVMGLYDEMAEVLGLRLITIDRWGLGRTDVPHSRSARGIVEWAGIVEEVLDLLHIEKCSVMAHSAGAPYALSFANNVPERIVGDICLLAPWVGGSEGAGAGYKWLKYVPNGILKTAQAAEWKVQAWMIGKPPTVAFEGIGYDATTSSSSPTSKTSSRKPSPRRQTQSVYPAADNNGKTRPSIGSRSIGSSVFSEYDDLKDFDGRFESMSTLGARRDSQFSRAASEGTPKKRKTSTGFLKKLTGGSNSQPQSPVERSPAPPGGRTLKALRSMGSLKGKTSSAPSTVNKRPELPPMPSLELPKPPAFDGLGFNDIDWNKSSSSDTSATPISAKFARTIGPSTPSPIAEKPTPSPTGYGSRMAGRRSISFDAHRASPPPSIAPSAAPSIPVSPVASSYNASTFTPSDISGGSYQIMLGNALIAASHAESAKGTHSDLLQILNHDHRPWGFSYTAYPHRVQVWYGDKDEKIAENAVRWMERNMGEGRCDVKVVKGADHSLMYKSSVVVEVLERVREYW